MSHYLSIIRQAAAGPDTLFREKAYGARGTASFLRDVIALANAAGDGPRYLLVGVTIDEAGGKACHDVPAADFSGNPPYAKLVAEFVEPALRVRHESATVDGKRVGVFEISACTDRPYMVRIDHSERLRRGDAWALAGGEPVRLGRSQLQAMFEAHFRDAVSPEQLELGFPGELIHKDCELATVDLAQRPSELARAKLGHVADVKRKSRGTGATTMLARLTHARLFGSDSAYDDDSPTDLLKGVEAAAETYRERDEHFLHEENAGPVQLVVVNHGSEPLRDVSLSIRMPRHRELFVAERLPPLLRDGEFVERGMLEADSYPAVSVCDNAVRVAVPLGDLPPGVPTPVFGSPLRVAAGSALAKRRLALRYTLTASNLRLPAKGKLRIRFAEPARELSGATC